MFGEVPDYNDLLDRHFEEEEAYIKRLPVCCECNEPIQDEHCCEFNGDLICIECLKENHIRLVEDCDD